MKITKITKESFKGDVYNLELNSNRTEDDLFWIEGETGTVTHNCFPKDMDAILFEAEKLGINMSTLKGAKSTNSRVRKNKDWEKMEGRAVSKRETNQLEIPLEFNQYGQEHC